MSVKWAHLMIHMDKAEGSHYRDEILSKVAEICEESNYEFIIYFDAAAETALS